MVKLLDDSHSEEGFPCLRWQQVVPTGESAYVRQLTFELKMAAVVMVFVFVAVYAGSGYFWVAVFASLIVGGMCVAGDKAFKDGFRVWDVHIKGPEPAPGAAEAVARARATAIMGTEQCEAVVAPHRETQELYFWVSRGAKPETMDCIAGVPLSSIHAFELGTAEEWFMDVAQAQLRRQVSAPNWWVIVAPTLGHDVIAVAESGGAKAGIAALHGLLTQRFVLEAPEMQQRWKERLEQAGTEQGQQS